MFVYIVSCYVSGGHPSVLPSIHQFHPRDGLVWSCWTTILQFSSNPNQTHTPEQPNQRPCPKLHTSCTYGVVCLQWPVCARDREDHETFGCSFVILGFRTFAVNMRPQYTLLPSPHWSKLSCRPLPDS